MRGLWVLLAAAGLLLAWGCDEEEGDDDDTVVDEGTPPEIIHEPVPDGQTSLVQVAIECIVTDDTGVSAVSLFYRQGGAVDWQISYLSPTGEPGGYAGTIAATVVTAEGVDYYIRAVDDAVPQAEAFSPDGAPDEFHHFDVLVVGETLPFFEDWEDGDVLTDLGWFQVEQGMGDYTWELSDLYAYSGGQAAMHKEGINGVPMFKDWLISPPLEFDGSTDVAVHWVELGLYTADMEVHQLYLSMGSDDPDAGDFELITDLTAPLEEQWAASEVIDITEQVGEGGVGFVAFYYEGEYPADKWFIDDVSVGEPMPDFVLDEITVDPEAFEPGDVLDISISVTNLSLVASEPVTGSLVSDDALLTQTGADVDYGVVEPGGTSYGDGSFELTIDAEHVDNAYLDLALRLTDGEHIWDLPFELLMGDESHAMVDYDASASGEVILTVGYGDPDFPSFEVSEEVEDTSQWSTAITSEAAHLPPEVGENRWWLKVTNDGLYPTTITGFEIEWGDDVFTSVELPLSVLAQSEGVAYLPSLPDLQVAAVITAPEPVAPGDAGVELTLRVDNVGGVATAGPLTGTLTSADPHVSNITGAGVTFGVDPLEPGEVALNDTPFTIDVDAAHVDDSDLELTLAVSDGVDTFDLDFSVAVPHAHAVLEQLVLDDSDFNDDGLLDRGETVLVTAVLHNAGDHEITDDLTVTIGQSATSEVTLTILDDTETLAGGLFPGQSQLLTEAFEFTADDGYMGDLAVLDIEITDGTDSWIQTFEVEIAAMVWTAITGADDPVGDANGYMFDIAQTWYKTDGEVMWIKTDSHTPFDETTLWMTYAFYDVPNWWRLEFHDAFGGFRVMDGWFDGWFEGDEITPTLPILYRTEEGDGTYSLLFRFLLEDLEVDGRTLRLGMHAGSCPFIYYCDTAEDDWFYLDLKNAAYGQEDDLLYIFAW